MNNNYFDFKSVAVDYMISLGLNDKAIQLNASTFARVLRDAAQSYFGDINPTIINESAADYYKTLEED